MQIKFELDGLPELGQRLDRIATVVTGPIAKEGLTAGAEIIQAQAQANVHKLTGALGRDVVIVVRLYYQQGELYALIGPGWDPENFRRSTQRRGRYANEAPSADQTTNPGLYGMFLETGHRAPGSGLAHNLEYKREAYEAHKAHKKVNTAEFGTLSTPPYPWLGPAFESRKEEALETVAEVIRERLESLSL